MERSLRKFVLFATLVSLNFPVCVNALGLGEMKVESALDQPFVAEIELIDARNLSLANVQVGLADPEGYQSFGVKPSETISSLMFEIIKNQHGRYVMRLHSNERMTEPYMQLVVDLIWPKGQIYKAYTVLLDPPGYKLEKTTAQSGLTYHRKFTNYQQKSVSSSGCHYTNENRQHSEQTIYGPTLANENVWQIAQRYKIAEAILPQIVLAMVGENPDAFSHGNLNGLKTGVRLNIPSNKEFLEVPADLATVEVMAHDKAWNEKTPISHVLSPPYRVEQADNTNSPIEYSQIPPVPKFSISTPAQNQTQQEVMSISSLPSLENKKQISPEQSRTLKAEISVTTAAVDTLRESNELLTEQLGLIQAQNKKLQKSWMCAIKKCKSCGFKLNVWSRSERPLQGKQIL